MSKTKVLMIDDSPILDRRVLVEAKSLQKAGYSVCVVCPSKTAIESTEEFVQGVRCFYVNISDEARLVHAVSSDDRVKPGGRIKEWLRKKPRLFQVLREIVNAINLLRTRLQSLRLLIKAGFHLWRGKGVDFFLRRDEAQEKLGEFILRSFDEIDVIHAHDLSILNLAIFLKEKFRSRLIFDAHEVYGLQYPKLDPIRYFYNLKERLLVPFVDAIITINADCVRLIKTNIGDNNVRFYEVSNAVDLPPDFNQKLQETKGIVRRYTGLTADKKIVVFTGGINKLRKVHLLVHAMKDVRPDVHLFLMPLPFQINEFKNLARMYGVEERVHFGPFVDSEEVLYWISDCDVGIMPYQPVVESIAISSPNKMFEFIACQRPMIGSSELKYVHKAISENGAGVSIPLRKVADYASAINLMFDERQGGTERFLPGLRVMRDRFSWATQEVSLLKCYENLH